MPPKCSSKRTRTGTSRSSQSEGRSAKSRRRGSVSNPSTVQGEPHEDTRANEVVDPLTTDANSSSNGPLPRNDILIIVQEVVKHLQPARKVRLNLSLCQVCVVSQARPLFFLFTLGRRKKGSGDTPLANLFCSSKLF